jgi:membrane protein DedA with SNARE-associated domain
MPALDELIRYWGYVAIVPVVVLGNAGLPVPEEAVLALAGYLVWRGELRLPVVLAVAITSAVAGDSLGYWVGRRYGSEAVERYGRRLGLPARRVAVVRRWVARYGAVSVFAARFIPGLRFVAGPLAGASGLRLVTFLGANVLGAMVYVPLAVTAGYAVSYGLGGYLASLRRTVGDAGPVALIAVTIGAFSWAAWRIRRPFRAGADP